MKVIPIDERDGLNCSSCDTELSVKYRLKGEPLCNLCVMQELIKSWDRSNNDLCELNREAYEKLIYDLLLWRE